MKMEVLSVQNQFQGQFGVIGSTKVKDWTSPLTPPPPPPPINTKNNPSGDVVDGRQTTNHYYHNHHAHQQLRQHQQHQLQQLQQHQHQQQQQEHINKTHHQYQYPYNQATMETATTNAVEGSTTSGYSYNNNLFCCDAPSPISTSHFGVQNNDIDANAVNELSQRLQAELRAAKSRHLACTEVSLPWDLTPRIAADIIKTSEREPCGVRGCSIFIEFEDEPNNIRRISSFQVDPNTVSTFELYLTLKQDKSGWTSLLPQFLKNLTRSNTILISPDFTLTKNKLYSCE